MKKAFWILLPVAIALQIATLLLFTVGIWSGDERWSITATLLIIPSLASAVATLSIGCGAFDD
jgi:hypothetical protein